VPGEQGTCTWTPPASNPSWRAFGPSGGQWWMEGAMPGAASYHRGRRWLWVRPAQSWRHTSSARRTLSSGRIVRRRSSSGDAASVRARSGMPGRCRRFCQLSWRPSGACPEYWCSGFPAISRARSSRQRATRGMRGAATMPPMRLPSCGPVWPSRQRSLWRGSKRIGPEPRKWLMWWRAPSSSDCSNAFGQRAGRQ